MDKGLGFTCMLGESLFCFVATYLGQSGCIVQQVAKVCVTNSRENDIRMEVDVESETKLGFN